MLDSKRMQEMPDIYPHLKFFFYLRKSAIKLYSPSLFLTNFLFEIAPFSWNHQKIIINLKDNPPQLLDTYSESVQTSYFLHLLFNYPMNLTIRHFQIPWHVGILKMIYFFWKLLRRFFFVQGIYWLPFSVCKHYKN